MKEISRKIGEVCRAALAAVFLVILVSAAGDATGRLSREVSLSLGWGNNQSSRPTRLDGTFQKSTRPDDAPSDRMTRDSRREHRTTSCQITAVILQWDKSESWPRLVQDAESTPVLPVPTCCGDRLLITNTCQVSSSLGRQFTLVGARPSGTS